MRVDEPTCTIDEQGPYPVRRPASVAELSEAVRAASAAGQAVLPLGGQTMLGVGLPPDRPGVGVDLRGLARVMDYPARDMTITVEAGITLAELQRVLAGEWQRLPIDVPHPATATLGGALAVNVSGSRRLGAGTLRDYVIGITTINDEGQPTRAGGRVVKNVAGYDLCKLHVGALGTLGIISQVTLKVRPRPEAQAILTFGCADAELGGLLDRLHASRTRPMCLDVLNAVAATMLSRQAGVAPPEHPWAVIVGFEDSEAAVNWQMQQLLRELTPDGVSGVEALAGASTEPLWQGLTEVIAWPDAAVSWKASVLPGRVADWCRLAQRHAPEALVHAHAGSGIVRGHLAGDLTAERAATMLNELARSAVDAGGNLVVPHCPPAWKRDLPVWGVPRPDTWLMRQVKQQLDPRRLFNPGRFLDAI
jgi:glycolate oxidase FAD binding subunit